MLDHLTGEAVQATLKAVIRVSIVYLLAYGDAVGWNPRLTKGILPCERSGHLPEDTSLLGTALTALTLRFDVRYASSFM